MCKKYKMPRQDPATPFLNIQEKRKYAPQIVHKDTHGLSRVSQKLKTRSSISWWMGKRVRYSYASNLWIRRFEQKDTEIKKKEPTTDKQYRILKNRQNKWHIVWSHLWNSRKDKTIVTKHIGGHLTEKDMREFFWSNGNILYFNHC